MLRWLITLSFGLSLLLGLPIPPAQAAEVLTIPSAEVLRIGDSNRSLSLRLACIQVPAEQSRQARAELQTALPRRTRVNLRLTGQEQEPPRYLGEVMRVSDGLKVNQWLLEQGLAKIRISELDTCAQPEGYQVAEAAAREAQRGIWQAPPSI
jgi:endonuclease YncB( thermonuclease family)